MSAVIVAPARVQVVSPVGNLKAMLPGPQPFRKVASRGECLHPRLTANRFTERQSSTAARP